MKQSKEILGKPIISIRNGKEIGKVKNFVINPDMRSIEFLIVQNDQWDFGIKAIPFKLVEGLGDYAVTIDTEGSVIDLADIPIANDLLTKNIQIKGTRIISKKGHFLGQIGEYYFSQGSGKILGCVVEQSDEEPLVLLEENVITFGKEITVVTEDAEKYLVKEETFRSVYAAKAMPQGNEDEAAATSEMAAELDELVGKLITANLYDEQGNLLLAEGEEITQDLVNRVKRLDRNKALELALKAME